MPSYISRSKEIFSRSMTAAIASLVLSLALAAPAVADQADAKRLLKAMSDYLAAQQSISFDYDAILGVVTDEGQNLEIASSGSVVLGRPDKIRVTRHGGFADVEMNFDGKTMTILGKGINMYTQIEAPGSIDNLVEVMRNQYGRPLPAADLVTSNAYGTLMQQVTDIKDLGSGVIGGIECDWLAFRSNEVDWQIWIAQGEQPYPCRFVITSKTIAGNPQYSIQTSKWVGSAEAATTDFSFTNSSNAEKVEPEDLEGSGDLPANFLLGESQ